MGSLPEIGENERALVVQGDEALKWLPAVVTDQAGYEYAGMELRATRGRARALDTLRLKLLRSVLDAQKTINETFMPPIKRWTESADALEARMLGYSAEQEAIRKTEEARLKAIEEAKAARDKAKLEAQAAAEREKADKLRREAEAKAEAERKRLQAEADALKAKRDKESREKRAELEARAKAVEADTAKADAMAAKSAAHENQAANTTAVDVEVKSNVKPVAGVAQKVVWKFRVVDFKSLPDTYKLTNEVMLGQIARSDKAEAKVPGVEFWSESVLAARGS